MRSGNPLALFVLGRCGLENAELWGSGGGLDECQSCAMEQVLILALGAFRAGGEDQHRGVQAGGVGPSRALGNNDLDKEDIAGRMLCLQQYRSRQLNAAVV